MKQILRSLLVATVAFAFAGCLQIEKVVSVKPDGSGTITEKLIMPQAIIAQMKQMMEGFAKGFGGDAPGKDAPAKPFDLMDEAKLREEAGKMGEGVTYVSAKKIKSDKGEGYIATYTFTDINKVKLDQNPGSAMPTPKDAPAPPEADSKPEIITFQFTKGKPSQLIISSPEFNPGASESAEKPKADEPENAAAEQMAMTMMQQMFKDMKVTVAVEFVGKIVKTDADNVAGNRVTLMEMDFNKLLANPEKFKQVSKAQPKTLEETKKLMKGVEGIKFESKPKTTIQFQ